MNFKILASLLTIGVASAAVGYGTFAAFSSTQTSGDNVFTTGTLTLELGAAASVDAFIGSANFAPGDPLSGNITLRNTGSIRDDDGAHDVKITISGVNSNLALARFVNITAISYGGAPIVVPDTNGNGHTDLADLEGVSFVQQDPLDGKDLALSVLFGATAGNDLQGAVNTLSLTFVLEQDLG